MHSSAKITGRYNSQTEKAFEVICTNLNLGLDILENFKPAYEQTQF